MAEKSAQRDQLSMGNATALWETIFRHPTAGEVAELYRGPDTPFGFGDRIARNQPYRSSAAKRKIV